MHIVGHTILHPPPPFLWGKGVPIELQFIGPIQLDALGHVWHRVIDPVM